MKQIKIGEVDFKVNEFILFNHRRNNISSETDSLK